MPTVVKLSCSSENRIALICNYEMSRLAATVAAPRERQNVCPPKDHRCSPSVHRSGWQDVGFALSFDAVFLGKAGCSAGRNTRHG